MSPLIKICGICRPRDGAAAAAAGADFVGLIFARQSKRVVDEQEAARIVEAVRATGDQVRTVGVFVNEDPGVIARTAAVVGLDLIQYHGDETADTIATVGLPSIKALRVRDRLPRFDGARNGDWTLFDTWTAEARGGTGRTFDWSLLADASTPRPFFLSGGLDPENVRGAIARVRPDGVDVSSGVEDEPRIKSHEKIERFIRQVKR